jgi:hypothetical protein
MPKELKKTKRFSIDLSFSNYEKFVKRAKKTPLSPKIARFSSRKTSKN